MLTSFSIELVSPWIRYSECSRAV